MMLVTNPGQMYQMWNVQSASKVIPKGKPCLTGTFNRRSGTRISVSYPFLSVVIFPNPKNFLMAILLIAELILGCTVSRIKNKVDL